MVDSESCIFKNWRISILLKKRLKCQKQTDVNNEIFSDSHGFHGNKKQQFKHIFDGYI